MKKKNYLLVLVAVFSLLGTACAGNSTTQSSAASLHATKIQVPSQYVAAESKTTTEKQVPTQSVATTSQPATEKQAPAQSNTTTSKAATVQGADPSKHILCSGMPGTELVADLNGDGSNDSIVYTNSDTTVNPAPNFSLTINGKDFTSVLKSDDFSDLHSSSNLSYYIVDLDTSDSYSEIAIQDNYIDDVYVTHFLRYDGSQVIYLGEVNDSIDQIIPVPTIHLNGDGTLSSCLVPDLSSFGVLFVPQTLALVDQKIVIQPKDFYTIDNTALNGQYSTHDILQDITVYAQPDGTGPVVLPAGTTGITFVATDTTNWVLLTDSNGTSYYASDAELIQKSIASNWAPIFSNLLWAD